MTTCRPAPSLHQRRRGRADSWLVTQALICVARSLRLLVQGRLHTPNHRVGEFVRLPDGRRFVVFRESTRDGAVGDETVTLAVWFHLWSIPAGADARRSLFERLCIVNTLLYAGFDGYLVKLWMVDPETADYAGLYSWRSAEEADTYGRYITALLGPLSSTGSVGYQVLRGVTLEEYLMRTSVGV
jgi:hypothetical protein